MRFDAIIHLAGFLGVKKSTVSELECIENKFTRHDKRLKAFQIN